MTKTVNVIILRAAGVNCDIETGFAFERSGAAVDFVHINELLEGKKDLKTYHILAIPGGFTYGDDIAAGRILANELRLKLGGPLREFIRDRKPVIGICNGFQVLVKAGILPGPMDGKEENFRQTATLMVNDSGKFEARWVFLKPEGRCIWTRGLPSSVFFPVAHGEGKFVPINDGVLKRMKENQQIIFRYVNSRGTRPVYPENPNGSLGDIAGISDRTGIILGLMPHPERHFVSMQHPFWTRIKKKSRFGDGAAIFRNGVDYVKKNLL